jgi:hypothetical protein
MSGSHLDSDRLAESVHGGTAWTVAEAAHLADCAECRLELDILAVARGLGAARLSRLDTRRVATNLQHRLGAAVASIRPKRQLSPWLLSLAAAAAVVFAVSLGIPGGRSGSGGGAPASLAGAGVLHELDGLSEPQLEEVLQSIPPATEALDHVEMAPLSDLSTSDLERVLRSIEMEEE